MLSARGAAIAVVVLTAALGGCATAGSADKPGPYAGPHNHFRDAKQGYVAVAAPSGAPAPKLLHDHRQMK